MNRSIQTKQNSPPFLELIKASRFIYARAARLGVIRVWIAIISISTIPFFVDRIRSVEMAISITVAILIVVSDHFLGEREETLKANGAKIQEKFDTDLYDMPWNQIAVGNPVLPEERVSYAKQDNQTNPIENWYPDTTGIRSPLDIMICQRANFVWDMRQREKFAYIILVGTFALIVFLIVLGAFVKRGFGAYVVAMICPAVPLVSQAYSAHKAHMKTVREKNELYEALDDFWEKELATPSSVTMDDCRRIQDRLFQLRKDGPSIPQKWYDRLRSDYENEMKKTADELRAEALSKVNLP